MSDTKQPEKELDVVIDADGTMRFVFDDDLAELIPAGYTCPIRRASHVEPTSDGRWTADMSPAYRDIMSDEQKVRYDVLHPEVGDGLTLGPFATRGEALLAEVAWLKEWAGV